MEELPKIVVERLGRSAGPQTHPDPDLINAFAENSLAEGDRTELLQHLARCSDCREVVALSLPEQAAPGLGGPQPVGAAALLSWPVLRWGALAACFVVVGAAVILRYESRFKSREMATAQAPGVAKLDEKIVPPAAPPKPDNAQGSNEISGGPPGNARDAISASSPPALKKAIPNRPAPTTTEKKLDALRLFEQPRSALQSAGTVAVNAAEPASPAPNGALAELVPGHAKEAESEAVKDNLVASAGIAAKQKVSAALAANKAMLPLAALLPRWTLSSDGTLQRSLDSGKTWETIPVGSQAKFRALAANGYDIWVGGSAGALFHSPDAGQHWTQMRPIAKGELLSADIIGVEFADPQHGKISTSAQETWTTDDGGQSWEKK
jgi:hypothetical protein